MELLESLFITHYPYTASIILMMVGFFAIIHYPYLLKKLIGLSLFQTAVILFYISSAYRSGGSAALLKTGVTNYMNPVPHVLMLTGIVVGVATFALAIALIVRIKDAYGTLYEDEIIEKDFQMLAASLQQHKRLEAMITSKNKKLKKTTAKPKAIRKLKILTSAKSASKGKR